MSQDEVNVVATNRKAFHDYHIEDRYEAGIVLKGTEIKSVRARQVSLREGYVQPRNNELWMIDVHIAPYEQAREGGHDPKRPRKLLLHRREIDRLISRVVERGYTIVPLQMYIRDGLAKVEIGLARGKRKYDKRRALREQQAEREMQRHWKKRGRQDWKTRH
jgi:SsrA-binding protein